MKLFWGIRIPENR